LEWYTVDTDGQVTVERFVANDPDCPEDIPVGLGDAFPQAAMG